LRLAGIFSGFVAVPGVVLGQLCGGIIIKKLKLKVQGLIKFNLINCMVVILLSGIFFVKCKQGDIAGITAPYR